MQVRFLTIERDAIFLLGYELKLSPTERKLLCCVAEGGRSDVDTMAKNLCNDVSRGNVAVHISAINRKAKKLSGRKLIIYENGQYAINPFM